MNIRVFTLRKGAPEKGEPPLEVYVALAGAEEHQERVFQTGWVAVEEDEIGKFEATAIYEESGGPYFVGYYDTVEHAMLALGTHFLAVHPEKLDPAVKSAF